MRSRSITGINSLLCVQIEAVAKGIGVILKLLLDIHFIGPFLAEVGVRDGKERLCRSKRCSWDFMRVLATSREHSPDRYRGRWAQDGKEPDHRKELREH